MTAMFDKKKKTPVKVGGNVLIVRENMPLAPKWLFYTAFLVSFSLPNLVFSGYYWYDTLHLWKWIVTMAPIGVVSLVMGVQLFRFGAKKTGFNLDPFGAVWLLLLLLITMQPAFIKISSLSTFAKEWFFFASLFAVYIIAYNQSSGSWFHRLLLWGGSMNAAVNVLFAELTFRGLNAGYPFILNVPGNYIGNTAQQEMFGLWMAMGVINCLFLHLYYVGTKKEAGLQRTSLILSNLFLLAVNSWGLWSSTTRGAILALLVSFTVLILLFWRTGDWESVKKSLKLFGVVILFLALVLFVSSKVGTGRGNALVGKMMDMVENPTAVGNRISIWSTSWQVFLKDPIKGVGLGQYKWHFLDGQRILFLKHPELRANPEYRWQYTYWAHSEYIQWLCETGVIGALLLSALALWWLAGFVKALVRREHIPPEAIWGCAMLFLLWFDALFSRPFHRIENSVWMALAFALANRALLPSKFKLAGESSDIVFRAFGALIAGVALYGFVFLAGGTYGDKLIYRSMAEQSSADAKHEQLRKAESFLMSRDDAEESIANLYIQAGKSGRDFNVYSEGVGRLYEAFIKRPSSKLLFEIVSYARQLESRELLNKTIIYLEPYMYEMFGLNSSGEIVSK